MIKNIVGAIAIIAAIVLLPFVSSYFSQKEYVKINKEIKSTLFDSYDEKNLLLFFGYVGCIDICTPRLHELSSIYEKLKKAKIETQVLFINLTKLEDPELADLFAKSFNKNFKGIYLEKPKLDTLKKEFNVYSAPALGNSAELDHTTYLYLLKKVDSKYYLNKIYIKTPFHISLDGNDL